MSKSFTMKKGFLYLLVGFAVITGVYFLFFRNNDNKSEAAPDQPLAVNQDNDKIDQAFNGLFANYEDLQKALVNWDTLNASKASTSIDQSAIAFPVAEMKADSNIVSTAKSFLEGISGEARSISATADIEKKRRSFAVISGNLYDLARTMQYNKGKIYKVTCPMAFNDEESADWLSKTDEVLNPYLGKYHPVHKQKMLECGMVTDSISN